MKKNEKSYNKRVGKLFSVSGPPPLNPGFSANSVLTNQVVTYKP